MPGNCHSVYCCTRHSRNKLRPPLTPPSEHAHRVVQCIVCSCCGQRVQPPSAGKSWDADEFCTQQARSGIPAAFDIDNLHLIQFPSQCDSCCRNTEAMCLRMAAGVMHQFGGFQQYPYTLFGLLQGGIEADALAEAIEKDSPCMRCPFADKVLRRFPTRADLLGPVCIAVLWAASEVVGSGVVSVLDKWNVLRWSDLCFGSATRSDLSR